MNKFGRSNNFAAVLWDLDGTLIDSEPIHFKVIVDFCATHGVELSPDSYELLIGKSDIAVCKHLNYRHGLNLTPQALWDGTKLLYAEHLHKLKCRTGVSDVVTRLYQRGICQAVVSSSWRHFVQASLAAVGLSKYFIFTICRDDVDYLKPHPEPYLTAANRLGVAPSQCLVVEDSHAGVQSAKRAGANVALWAAPENPLAIKDTLELGDISEILRCGFWKSPSSSAKSEEVAY